MSTHLSVVPSTTSRNAATALPLPATDAQGDYELSIFLDFDFQDYGARRTGGNARVTYGQYQIAAGREDGAWRMQVRQVLAEDAKSGEHIFGPDLMDVQDQTEGPDPLALLQTLLGGHAMLNGTQVIRGLRHHELDALTAASPELKAELITLLSRDYMEPGGEFARWFGRWVLTASAADIDGYFHTNPYYMELAQRVRAENLVGKALVARRAEIRAFFDAMEALPEDDPALASYAADLRSLLTDRRNSGPGLRLGAAVRGSCRGERP